MSKIFETQFEKGSYISRQGVVGTPNAINSSWIRGERGYALSPVTNPVGATTNAEVAYNVDTEINSITLIAWIRKGPHPGAGQAEGFLSNKLSANYGVNLSCNDAGLLRTLWGTGAGSEYISSGVNLIPGNHYQIAITITGTSYVYYINGVNVASSSATVVIGYNDNNKTYVGSFYTTASLSNRGLVYKGEVHNKQLSASEIAKDYTEFLQAQPVAIEKYPSYNPFSKPSDLSSVSDLIAAYNMIPSTGGVLVDVSDNDGNGVITGPISTLDGLRFDGVDDTVRLYIEAGIAVTVKTICFRIKLDTTTEEILEGGTGTELIYAAAGTLVYADYSTAYINGIETDTVVANQWMNIVITSETPVSNATATLGLNVIV